MGGVATSALEKPLGSDTALAERITSHSFQVTLADLVKRAYVSYTIAHQRSALLGRDDVEGEQERKSFDAMVEIYDYYLRRAEILVAAYRGDALPDKLDDALMFLLQIYTVLRGRELTGLGPAALLAELPTPREVFVALSDAEVSAWLEEHGVATPPPDIVLPRL